MLEAHECCTSAGWHRELCNGARCRELLQQRGNTCQRQRELQCQWVSLAQQGGQIGRSVTYFSVTQLQCSSGQHDERRCSADAVLGERTSNNTDAEGVVV